MRNHSTLKQQRIRLFERGNDRCPVSGSTAPVTRWALRTRA